MGSTIRKPRLPRGSRRVDSSRRTASRSPLSQSDVTRTGSAGRDQIGPDGSTASRPVSRVVDRSLRPFGTTDGADPSAVTRRDRTRRPRTGTSPAETDHTRPIPCEEGSRSAGPGRNTKTKVSSMGRRCFPIERQLAESSPRTRKENGRFLARRRRIADKTAVERRRVRRPARGRRTGYPVPCTPRARRRRGPRRTASPLPGRTSSPARPRRRRPSPTTPALHRYQCRRR